METYFSANPRATKKLAGGWAASLRPGEIVALIGELGAGKTVFTQGLAAALGVQKNITSPTFTLLKIYPARRQGIKRLVHIDAYRLKTSADLDSTGWLDYLDDPAGLVVVEWADKIKHPRLRRARIVRLAVQGQGRLISFS
ncbi:tRNA (adenosine(37)-N6)-threonylcarbamoyltransferase complex ATPase subunit type 1 TsaE [Candidatus Falkowbacteria bacterium CG_4_10_14_0_2_um_filter_48_10]|uniref:tRNA threonylcarbamoyladenosine biosynthesis protein TsaE n=1 Tax=Candidatus Falkowbacteria bacterium CG23_combo_of_CG06-09_8_20_14_all_49_15 TaxID=1974572 RepID=A0A2G9ZLH5_9BACT|nr:MAG: tRNA (adenosine(37)-N6)-threonylcarbamoyltransferase complex ATPase subunit type 1 TsaE [Candidatus Falkowbacteria bacterium CG23_combo_of_CG06-09_8_20_14_all_49_15]PJA08762.1 MAG: tRNA (adenosine(37)-N6)-threonylcarbamoyltransferase complex ATPase subunit type 1 TsaE [Candidatus Falkowbacteria bacterium CG_4_10_14_0_2_um_filter_48_10]